MGAVSIDGENGEGQSTPASTPHDILHCLSLSTPICQSMLSQHVGFREYVLTLPMLQFLLDQYMSEVWLGMVPSRPLELERSFTP